MENRNGHLLLKLKVQHTIIRVELKVLKPKLSILEEQ